MTFSERLQKAVSIKFNSQKEFAEIIGIIESNLSRYLSDGRQPNINILTKILYAGISLDWLLSGQGSMFVDICNEIPQENDREMVYKDLPHDRMKKWIDKNYGSLKNFTLMMNLDFYYINKMISDNVLLDIDLLSALRTAGCNIDWLATGKGSEYEDNPIGTLLKLKTSEINETIVENENIDLKQLLKNKDFSKLTQKAIMQLILQLVEENIDQKVIKNANN